MRWRWMDRSEVSRERGLRRNTHNIGRGSTVARSAELAAYRFRGAYHLDAFCKIGFSVVCRSEVAGAQDVVFSDRST